MKSLGKFVICLLYIRAILSLCPFPLSAEEPTIYLIGHAHIDAAWRWPYSHTRDEVCRRTFTSVLDLMDEYPQLKFTQSSAQFYKWMEEDYPEIFERIRERIAEGRWEIVGGMWIEPDSNLPCGESFVRQILYGKKYSQQKFGVDVKIGWTPDSFGYNWNLPQIYKKSGIDYFYTQKINWNDTTKFPYHCFWWEGPDGSRIIVHQGVGSYGESIQADKISRDLFTLQQKHNISDLAVVFGLGDHGGGPSRQMIERGIMLQGKEEFPEVVFSLAKGYFAKLAAQSENFPVVKDELYLEYHRGCATTHAETKRNNRKSECLMMNAEKLAAVAMKYGFVYPQQQLNEAWELVLFNQFHDILPGSSVPCVYEDAAEDYAKVFEIGNQTISNSLDKIAAEIDTTGEGIPILVFNPLSWERTSAVEIRLSELGSSEFVNISEANGQIIPAQIITDNRTKHALFIAEDVPAMGYKLYQAIPAEKLSQFETSLSISASTAENEFYRIKISPETGCLTSIYDKVNSREIIDSSGEGNIIQLYDDNPTLYDAWNIKLGELTELDIVEQPPEIVEAGPVRARIRVIKTTDNSTFTQDIILTAKIPQIDLEAKVDWYEYHQLAKVAFPLNLSSEFATYEIPYAPIVRRNWDSPDATPAERAKWEVNAQKWIDYTDSSGSYGVSLLNDSKYGFDVKTNIIRMTLLRSPFSPESGYGFGSPSPTDEGEHQIRYALYPHKGDWREACTVRKGYEFNYPLLVKVDTGHSGELPREYSFFAAGPDDVILTVAKKDEDSEATILRFYETNGTNTTAWINLPEVPRKVWETDLMENELQELSGDKKLSIPINHFEIKTIKVLF